MTPWTFSAPFTFWDMAGGTAFLVVVVVLRLAYFSRPRTQLHSTTNYAMLALMAHDERDYDWTAVTLDTTGLPQWWATGYWCAARPADGKTARELAFYHCAAPVATPLRELMRVAGARWAIEECYQAAKNEAGLDHYQVRTWRAWCGHITHRAHRHLQPGGDVPVRHAARREAGHLPLSWVSSAGVEACRARGTNARAARA
jgi:hypothetical protein